MLLACLGRCDSRRHGARVRTKSLRDRRMEYPDELRFVTYLSPGIPLAFFEAVVEHVRLVLG